VVLKHNAIRAVTVRTKIISNGGSCFLPMRIAEPLIHAKKLFHLPGSPQFRLPAYMVFPRDSDSIVLQQVLESLRSLAIAEQKKP